MEMILKATEQGETDKENKGSHEDIIGLLWATGAPIHEAPPKKLSRISLRIISGTGWGSWGLDPLTPIPCW